MHSIILHSYIKDNKVSESKSDTNQESTEINTSVRDVIAIKCKTNNENSKS